MEFQGSVNMNGRVYPPEVLKKAVESFNERAQDRPFFGFLGESDRRDLANVSHVVERMEMRPDGAVIGTFKTLDTKAGRMLQKMVGSGVNIGVSMRGIVHMPQDIISVVARLAETDTMGDFRITGVSIVPTPENPDAGVHPADV